MPNRPGAASGRKAVSTAAAAPATAASAEGKDGRLVSRPSSGVIRASMAAGVGRRRPPGRHRPPSRRRTSLPAGARWRGTWRTGERNSIHGRVGQLGPGQHRRPSSHWAMVAASSSVRAACSSSTSSISAGVGSDGGGGAQLIRSRQDPGVPGGGISCRLLPRGEDRDTYSGQHRRGRAGQAGPDKRAPRKGGRGAVGVRLGHHDVSSLGNYAGQVSRSWRTSMSIGK